jgi:hypothetical protein
LASLNRIASFNPAGKTLIENLHIPIAVLQKNAIGQTGQVVGASSIQNNESISWYLLQAIGELVERNGDRALDMGFAVLLIGTDIDEERPFPRYDFFDQLVEADEGRDHVLG